MNKSETSVIKNRRELSITRLFNAPIDLVWRAWTELDLIKQWWGPNGFTDTVDQMNMDKLSKYLSTIK